MDAFLLLLELRPAARCPRTSMFSLKIELGSAVAPEPSLMSTCARSNPALLAESLGITLSIVSDTLMTLVQQSF